MKQEIISLKKQNGLMSKNNKKISINLNYIEHFIVLASTVTGCISIFASLFGIPIGITSSAIGSEIWAITAGTKKYKWRVQKTKEFKNLKKQEIDDIFIKTN